MKIAAVASALIVSLAVPAFAQSTPPTPPAPPANAVPEMGPATTPPEPMGPKHHEPRPGRTGFDLRMGDDNGLKVDCGEEPLAACIQAAQPLIEKLGAKGN